METDLIGSLGVSGSNMDIPLDDFMLTYFALLEFQRVPQDQLVRTAPDKYAAWLA
jgi:hypothetical protein